MVGLGNAVLHFEEFLAVDIRPDVLLAVHNAKLIRFSIACVGYFPGGLAIAGVFACMLFAALSGSSPATVVAIGTIVITGSGRSVIPKSSPPVSSVTREPWVFSFRPPS